MEADDLAKETELTERFGRRSTPRFCTNDGETSSRQFEFTRCIPTITDRRKCSDTVGTCPGRERRDQGSFREGGGLILLCQQRLHQITELLRGELISFDVGRKLSTLIDHDGVERVGDDALSIPKIHAEHPRYLLNVG
jgi:hypothetical protein